MTDPRDPPHRDSTDRTEPVPSGTVTFVFTDIEGSTRLWEEDPAAAGALVAHHDRLLRGHVTTHAGRIVKGTGDGVLAAFASANDALEASVAIQKELQAEPAVRARIAIHTGEAVIRESDYFGVAVNRCARVLAVAHGDQILMTLATAQVLSRPLPDGVGLLDLGSHRLRDVPEPIQLFQVTHPELRAEFPPLHGTQEFAHNLPVQLTTFVGRERELSEVRRALSASRMLTLTGIGGGGKSRLAVQLASELIDEFPSGVWMAALTSVAEPELVARSIADAVGVPEEPGRSPLDTVARRLRQAPALLLLDNCEHLLAACAEASRHLLRSASSLKILATSRERLGVEGEAIYVVPPMSVPTRDESSGPDRALGHDAVRLFVQRAQLAAPQFRLDEATAPVVGRICRLLDGIPLAIELAASRVGSLTVEQISSRLESRLEIVAAGPRAGDARHETMLATLDWSYELLSPPEREILAQLSAFHGSFDLAQVEAVCLRFADDELLARIMALLDKSLLLRDPGTGRYRLLEPVRKYAWEKVESSGWEDELARSHAVYFTELVEALAGDGDVPSQVVLDRLEHEHDNVRAALRWSLDHDETGLAIRIGSVIWPFWKLRGHLSEGRRWLERALAAEPDADPAVLAHALRGAGDLASGQGDYDQARQHLERSLALAEDLADDAEAASILTRLAGLPHRRGDLRQATRLFEEALERARRVGEPSRTVQILTSLALLSEDQGEVDAADRYVREALRLRSAATDLYTIGDALLASGEISINRGDWDAAHRALDEALRAARAAGFTDVTAWATAYLGKLALGRDLVERAEELLSNALAMFQRLGVPVGAAWAMRHLGRAALSGGDVDQAEALFTEALQIALTGVRPDAPLALHALAEVMARRSDYERAAILASAAEAARESMGLMPAPDERRAAESLRDDLIGHLGEARLGELAAQGAAMSLEEATFLADTRVDGGSLLSLDL